jgi:hypothetical protein
MSLLAACSSYSSGGPARSVCLVFKIDYAGADVFDEITVVKIIDLSSGKTVYASLGSAFLNDHDGARGFVAHAHGCARFPSTGTKKVVAFYRPGMTEVRAECVGSANLFSSRCMPGPGDIVAETFVDIEEGDDLVVELTMGESK